MDFKHDYAFDFFKLFKSNSNNLKKAQYILNNEDVSFFTIAENKVIAIVNDKKKTFNIVLKFNLFSDSQKEFIKELINDSPEFIAKLTNKEIHSQLSISLLNENIYLIPNNSSDISMECNCNIKARPCRHILAVLLYLSKKMDEDPFLLFKLHGFDISKEIDFFKEYTGAVRQVKYFEDLFNQEILDEEFNEDFDKLNEMNDFFNLIPKSRSYMVNLMESESEYDETFITVFKIIYDLLSLSSKLIFNFKFHFGADYNNAIILKGNNDFGKVNLKKESKKEFLERIFNVKWNNPYEWTSFNIDVSGDFQLNSISADVTSPFDSYNGDLSFILLGFIIEFDNCDVSKLPYPLQFLNTIKIFTLKLISKYLIVPDLFKSIDGFINLMWVPNINNSVVNEICSKLVHLVPDGLITINNNKLSKKETINILIAIIADALVKKQFNSLKSSDTLSLFIKNKLFINGHLNPEYAYLLSLNLGLYHLRKKDYSFYFIVDEKDTMFSLNLKVSLDDELYSIEEIVGLDIESKYEIISDFQLIKDYISNSNIKIDEGYWINFDSFMELYNVAFPFFESIGVDVLLPDSLLINKYEPQIKLNMDKEVSSSLTFSNISDFDWRVAVGESEFSKEEFEKLVKESRKFIKHNNQVIVLDEDVNKRFLEKYDKINQNSNKNDALQLLLLSQINDEVLIDEKLSSFLDDITNFKDVEIPKSVNANLREYQEVGFSWLVQNIGVGFGSILADDMGLGKTLEVLTTIVYLKENNLITGKILIVAPTSLLTNWQKEIEKFTPSLSYFIYHGPNRQFPEEEYDIILTSFGMVRHDIRILYEYNWYLLVVDEAQNIKNPSSKQTSAIKLLKADNKIALTGTPVENSLSEYWSIFDFTNKDYFGSYRSFKQNYIKPIQEYNHEAIVEKFKLLTSPFILRRLKSDKNIIDSLPDKFVNDIYCHLTEKQAALYQDTLDQYMGGIEASEGISRKGNILKLITALKQICNHPAQFMKSDVVKVEDSGKLAILMNILENILASNEKVLIFTQYVQMGNILKESIEDKFDCEALFLHGSQTRSKRDKLVDKFQNNSDSKIFIISLKAGGSGLNLTAAQNVIHYDLWWNPAVENQATDRAYRIGQEKNVMVYRFVTSGTFEENINKLIMEKEELASKTVVSNTKFITELSNDELKTMFKLD